MKKKLLTLSCAIALSLTMTSCSLKSAITGENKADTSSTNKEATLSNKEDTSKKDETKNIASAPNKENVEDKTSSNNKEEANNKKSSNDIILNNKNSVENTTVNNKNNNKQASNTVNRNCRIFYFNKLDLKSYCIDTTVNVTDNAFVTALTEKLYKAPNNNENFIVLSKDYGVSSATLNYENNILNVVFNENFIKDMNLSNEVSDGVIKSIVNTYGYNYGVEKVAVYFKDELYTKMKEGSSDGYFKVDYSDVLKL